MIEFLWVLCLALNWAVMYTDSKFYGIYGVAACILMVIPANREFIPVFCTVDSIFAVLILYGSRRREV